MRALTQKQIQLFQRAAICALVLFCAQPAIAQQLKPSVDQLAMYEAAPEEERVKLLVRLAKSDLGDVAQGLLQTYPLQGPHAENRTFYINGIILKSRGDLTGAAKQFRAALSNDPSLTLVRSELAATLVALEQDDSAKHHLKLLAAEAPTQEEAAGIRSFIEQVDSRKPYKINGFVSLAPSSNLNYGSKRKTVYSPVFNDNLAIDKESRAKSGLGVAGGVNGAYTQRLGNDLTFLAAGGASASVYDNSEFNSYGFSQTAELRHAIEHGYVSLGAVGSQSLSNDDFGLSYISYGPRVAFNLQVAPQDSVNASVVHEWRNSLHSDGIESTVVMVNGAWTHGFDASFNTTVFAGYDVINTKFDETSYTTKSAGLSIYKEMPFGITTNLTGRAARSNFKGYSNLGGAFREDTRLSGSIELTKRDWNWMGFAPSLEYSYTENLSNINLYDFNAHAVDFRLTKEF
jgi:outer membrane protein